MTPHHPLNRPAAVLGLLQVVGIATLGVLSWLAPEDPGYPEPSTLQVTISIVVLSLCAAFSAFGSWLLWNGKRSGAAWLVVPALAMAAGFFWQPVIVAVSLACVAAYAVTWLVPARVA